MKKNFLIEYTCILGYPDKKLDNLQHLGQKIERQGNCCDPNHIEYYLLLVWSMNSRDNKIHLYQSLPMKLGFLYRCFPDPYWLFLLRCLSSQSICNNHIYDSNSNRIYIRIIIERLKMLKVD